MRRWPLSILTWSMRSTEVNHESSGHSEWHVRITRQKRRLSHDVSTAGGAAGGREQAQRAAVSSNPLLQQSNAFKLGAFFEYGRTRPTMQRATPWAGGASGALGGFARTGRFAAAGRVGSIELLGSARTAEGNKSPFYQTALS